MEFAAPVMHGGSVQMVLELRDATAAWLIEDSRILSSARWTPD
jgi:hypothetical protein